MGLGTTFAIPPTPERMRCQRGWVRPITKSPTSKFEISRRDWPGFRSACGLRRFTMAVQGEKIIGIDLGTTNSVVAVMEGSECKVIPNQEGNRLTPSVVAFTDKGEILVGRAGQTPGRHQSQRTRSIRSSDSWAAGTTKWRPKKRWSPTRSSAGQNDYVKVKVGDKEYTPPEISAFDAPQAERGGRSVSRPQSQQGRHHGAGLLQRRPAASHQRCRPNRRACRSRESSTSRPRRPWLTAWRRKKRRRSCVFDLGGGTFDVSVLEVGDGVFDVISTNGDTHLGGDDFDQRLINFMADKFKKENGIDLRKDPMALQRLHEAAKRPRKNSRSSRRPTSICRSSRPTPAGPSTCR